MAGGTSHQNTKRNSRGIRKVDFENQFWFLLRRKMYTICLYNFRLAREKAERKLQQRTNPKGNISIGVNATDIFNPYEDENDEE